MQFLVKQGSVQNHQRLLEPVGAGAMDSTATGIHLEGRPLGSSTQPLLASFLLQSGPLQHSVSIHLQWAQSAIQRPDNNTELWKALGKVGRQNVPRRRSWRKNVPRAHTAAGRMKMSLTFTQGEFTNRSVNMSAHWVLTACMFIKSRPYSQLLVEPKGG